MKLNNKTILTLVATGFLFYALSDGLPIGYFTLLRFVVCAVSIYLAYKTYEENKESLWIWAFGFVAVLFNPIIPIHLQREQWESIDLATGIFFIASILWAGLKGKIKNKTVLLNVDIEKLKNAIRSTGKTTYVVGWITIVTNMVIYIWSISDKNFADSGLPAIDSTGTLLMVFTGIVFLILGGRIKQLIDVKIKNYLEILIALSVVLFIWVVWSGGHVGIVFFVFVAYLIYGLVTINKLMKVEEFTSKLTNPKYSFSSGFWGMMDSGGLSNKKIEPEDNADFNFNIKKEEVFAVLFILSILLILVNLFNTYSVEKEMKLCKENKGINAKYDNKNDYCGCDTGYISNGSSTLCIPIKTGLETCQERSGVNATYESSSNSCGCKTGYTHNGKSCITLNQSCRESYSNSEWSGKYGDKGETICDCTVGYGWNKSQTACIPSSN